jgi:hypothetical protein
MPTKRRGGRRAVVGMVAGMVAGMVVGGTLAFAGVTLASSAAPPTSLNTCTKIHKGLYGKTKVTAADSCPNGQDFQQWVPKGGVPNPCGAAIATQAGLVQGTDGDVWAVVVPVSRYSSSCIPTGEMASSGGGNPGFGATPLQDSGATSGIDYSSQAAISNGAVDYWGVDLDPGQGDPFGLAEESTLAQQAGATLSYVTGNSVYASF